MVGEHLTFDEETSGEVRGPPTSLTLLFTLAVAFGSISPLLRYYRAARSARFLRCRIGLPVLSEPDVFLPPRISQSSTYHNVIRTSLNCGPRCPDFWMVIITLPWKPNSRHNHFLIGIFITVPIEIRRSSNDSSTGDIRPHCSTCSMR